MRGNLPGFQARSVGDYRRRLGGVAGRDGMVSVAQHFGPRFHEFREREGKGLTAGKAERFGKLARERGIGWGGSARFGST